MNLKDLKLEYRYRTGRNNLVADFFNPCLMNAVEYRRTAGFFSASSLVSLTRGLESLLNNGGSMKLIVSPILSVEDINAIKSGYEKRDIIEKNCIAEIAKINWDSGAEALAWLIANNKLDIKIALRKNINHQGGIYHEKMGIIKDEQNDYIAFSGSPNESITAHEFNFESIDVDFSWNDIRGVAKEKLNEFNELWNDTTNGLEVIEFSEAAKRKLLQRREYSNEEDFIQSCKNKKIITSPKEKVKEPSIPDFIVLREYQKDAIMNWFENDCRGMFKMATGTGKTITALAATAKLIEAHKAKNRAITIIIVCPYKHLVTQWDKECKNFNIKNIKCFDSRSKWFEQANIESLSLNKEYKYTCLITTNATFSLDSFQAILGKINSDLLFIVDEAHNIGSKKQLNLLPEKANYRLALSATPERWFDEKGTEGIIDYFGKAVIEFGLKEALAAEFLTPYYYYPHLVELTDDERYNYNKISKQLGILFSKKTQTKQDKKNIEMLLIKRSRICASAFNKTKILFQLMKEKGYVNKKHILIYCGDGQVEDEFDDEESIKQTHLVIETLGKEFGMKIHPFTANENMSEREDLKERFSNGDLQALVAIRCLDEGVDIPAIKTAFILASSTNPRQFIQRRGRVLRKSDGKEFAEIYDFIIVPPIENISDDSSFNTERNMFQKELIRINEFAELAENGAQAKGKFLELRKKYNLLGI